jgi:hypothetical protein
VIIDNDGNLEGGLPIPAAELVDTDTTQVNLGFAHFGKRWPHANLALPISRVKHAACPSVLSS